MIFLGIDPGLGGALAFYDPDAKTLAVHDMPTLALTRGGKAKREIDVYELARLVDGPIVQMAVVERVGAMPGQGTSSMFAFGKAAGIALMACAANFIRVEEVAPATWRKTLAVPKGKDGSRARASQIYPEHAGLWSLKKHDGRAEAALLAGYAWRLFHQRTVTP